MVVAVMNLIVWQLTFTKEYKQSIYIKRDLKLFSCLPDSEHKIVWVKGHVILIIGMWPNSRVWCIQMRHPVPYTQHPYFFASEESCKLHYITSWWWSMKELKSYSFWALLLIVILNCDIFSCHILVFDKLTADRPVIRLERESTWYILITAVRRGGRSERIFIILYFEIFEYVLERAQKRTMKFASKALK